MYHYDSKIDKRKKEPKSPKIYSKVLGVKLSDDVFFPGPTSILEAEKRITENRKIQTAVTFFFAKTCMGNNQYEIRRMN